MIADIQVPDHRTTARFRQANQEELATVLTDVLRLCGEARLAKEGLVALDGTKLKANRSSAANRTCACMKEEKRMLAAGRWSTRRKKTCGEKRGDEPPDHLKNPLKGPILFQEAKARPEREAAAEAAEQKQRQGR